MSRTIASTVVSHVTGATVRPIYLMQMQFDSGNLNLWTGYGELTHTISGIGSVIWTGAGNIWGISAITETNGVRATGVDLSLSGLNSDIISVALSEDYQDRTVIIWLGFMNDNGTVLGEIEMFRGRADIMSINETGDSTTVSLTAESTLIGLERSNERRFTKEDQQIEFPNDLGFDTVPQLQQKEIVWGRT